MEIICYLFLTLEVSQDNHQISLAIWTMPSNPHKWYRTMETRRDLWLNISHIVIIIVTADGLAPLGARTSAGTVLSKFSSHIYMGSALKSLIHPLHLSFPLPQ